MTINTITKFVFSLLVLFFSVTINAQTKRGVKLISTNGEVFTPKGDLRCLIIFAGFDGYDKEQDFENWPADSDLPEYIIDGKIPSLFFSDTATFNNYPSEDNMSVSRLFYEMSDKKFRFMADVYPKRINISPKDARSWGDMNKRVLEEMKKKDPEFDWSPYDKRINRPNYRFDNSRSHPDGKPDYVIICYRYDKGWKYQPRYKMNRWQGSGGGVSVLVGARNFKYSEDITITSDGFHMNSVGVRESENFRRLFQHELGHELLSCPHHFGTGGTLGPYFRSSIMGWGTAVNSASCTRLINSWERWMLGWIELKHDLKDYKDNGVYEIDDYATTNDVIRIKIPHTESQYLWIENHQLESIFDQSRWTGSLKNSPKGSSGMSNISKGLYMYVEDMMDDRKKIRTQLVFDMQAVNGTKFLNANGNWDYKEPKDGFTKSWKEYWNNVIYTFERSDANPYDGINPFVTYRFDANGDGKIANRHNFNGASNAETFAIVKERVGDSTFLFYGNHASTNEEAKRYRRVHSFVPGDTLSLSHNPPIINNPKYDSKLNKNMPVYINGIRLVVLEEDNGKYTIEVKYDNNVVHKDTRISGNVVLKPIENLAIDLDVQKGVQLSVNKSGTINTLVMQKDSSFITPTEFVVDSAVINMQESSQFIIEDSSIVLFKNGSKLMVSNSEVVVSDKAGLYIGNGSEVLLDAKTKVKCGKTAVIVMQKGAIVNGEILKEDFKLPQGDSCSGSQLLKSMKKLNK